MVEYIESNGKKYPILTNTFVWGKVQLETGMEYHEILSDLSTKIWLFEPVIWHSLVVGHAVAKEKFELKREDMIVFLSNDQVYIDYLELLPKFVPKAKGNSDSEELKKNHQA